MYRHFVYMKGGAEMPETSYLTIRDEANDEFVEKRSRFIGYVKPVKTQDEAIAFINEIKTKHWDAKHNVYAYILRDGQIRRYSDDGEPQGTAGVPVLDVLLKENVTDCCVVVTRYFGGILLGGGGLVRAYSHSASIALAAGGIVEMKLFCKCKTTCDYTFYGRLPSLIADFGGKVVDTAFEADVCVDYLLPMEEIDKFREKLTDLSLGKAYVDIIGEEFGEA